MHFIILLWFVTRLYSYYLPLFWLPLSPFFASKSIKMKTHFTCTYIVINVFQYMYMREINIHLICLELEILHQHIFPRRKGAFKKYYSGLPPNDLFSKYMYYLKYYNSWKMLPDIISLSVWEISKFDSFFGIQWSLPVIDLNLFGENILNKIYNNLFCQKA
jgi:hypothetical protein